MGGRKDICGARFGTSFEARRWLSLDACGFLGISLSLSAHAFAFVVIASRLIAGSLLATAVFVLLYTPSVILAVASLYMAWTTNPGAVPLGARPLVTVKRAASGEIMPSDGRRIRALRRCPKCNDNFKPARAHHDSVTGRCIVKFDHFCPWVGNAVGAMNHKFFVLFVSYTMASCLFSLCLIGMRTWHCGFPLPYYGTGGDEPPKSSEECVGWMESYSSLLLFVITVVFLIFTTCMLFENIEAIGTNASKIARMKMSVGQAGTELSRVTEAFNEMFGGESNEISWHWFFPLPVEFPRGMHKVVMGFEWDETFDAAPYEEPKANGDVEMGVTSGAGVSNGKSPSPIDSNFNKQKNSEHQITDDPRIRENNSQSFSSPSALSVKQGSSRLVKRGSSRDRSVTGGEDPLRQGTLT